MWSYECDPSLRQDDNRYGYWVLDAMYRLYIDIVRVHNAEGKPIPCFLFPTPFILFKLSQVIQCINQLILRATL